MLNFIGNLLQNWYLIWLCVSILISIKVSYDILKKENETDLKILLKIHERSSITWYKINSDLYPSLLDFLLDVWYILKNLKKNWRYFLAVTVLFFFSFKILKPITAVYLLMYLIFFIIYMFTIIKAIILKETKTIEMRTNFQISSPYLYHLVVYITSPSRWAFISIYLIAARVTGKFHFVGGPTAVSILFLKSPLWFVFSCFIWSCRVVDILTDKQLLEKTPIGVLRVIKWEVRDFLYLRSLKSLNLTFRIVQGRRIIIEKRNFRINGGITALLREAGLVQSLQFTIPCRIFVGGQWHQAFRKNETSDQYFILTSSNEITPVHGDKYNCIRLDYTSDKEQYCTLSYIDTSEHNYKEGWSILPAVCNNLNSHEYFFGNTIKLNIIYNYYTSNKIFIQTPEFSYVYTLSKAVPAAISHLETRVQGNQNLEEITAKSEENIKLWKSDDPTTGRIVNDLLQLNGSDIFNIVQKDLLREEFEGLSKMIKEEHGWGVMK